jgi:hypothetical protein
MIAFAASSPRRDSKRFPSRTPGKGGKRIGSASRSPCHGQGRFRLVGARLAPVAADAADAYRILVFHFAEGSNASGFVAWLAGLMKTEAATGVMVVCGFDARATPALWQTSLGLFDYWGCPWNRGDDVVALVERLRRKGAHQV